MLCMYLACLPFRRKPGCIIYVFFTASSDLPLIYMVQIPPPGPSCHQVLPSWEGTARSNDETLCSCSLWPHDCFSFLNQHQVWDIGQQLLEDKSADHVLEKPRVRPHIHLALLCSHEGPAVGDWRGTSAGMKSLKTMMVLRKNSELSPRFKQSLGEPWATLKLSTTTLRLLIFSISTTLQGIELCNVTSTAQKALSAPYLPATLGDWGTPNTHLTRCQRG